MKGSKIGLLVLVVGLMTACGEEDKPNAPTVINITNINTNTLTPSTGASPTPVTGKITRIAVVSFGEGSCTGTGGPIAEPATVRVGCVEDVTCTPKMQGPDGREINAPPNVHGSAPESFDITDGVGNATFTRDANEPFNGRLKATKAGTATVSCTVGDLTGTKVFTLVQ